MIFLDYVQRTTSFVKVDNQRIYELLFLNIILVFENEI